jgi:hypothetical protein
MRSAGVRPWSLSHMRTPFAAWRRSAAIGRRFGVLPGMSWQTKRTRYVERFWGTAVELTLEDL